MGHLTKIALSLVLVATASDLALAQSEMPKAEEGLISIVDAAPQVYYGLKRMNKFYGDKNLDHTTIDGSPLERQYLLGSLGGVRDKAAEHGLFIDAGVTQVFQGAASGDGDGGTYFGSGDVWGLLDTGRAGLWSGGLIIAHFEGNWGDTVSGTGALLPIDGDAIMPAGPSAMALSEFYAVQGLPAGFSVLAGKANFSGLADKSLFANDERGQFLYEGLINNPILGSFVPYTTLGGAVNMQVSDELVGTVVLASNDNEAVSPGFDSLGFDAMTYGFAVTWTPTFDGLPGNYNALVGYSTKDVVSFDVDPRYLIGEIVGAVPVATKDGNYAVTLGGSQYLWVDETARRSDNQPVGIGPFFRYGWSPDDRNLIDQFISVGLGGLGGPFGRSNDNWGIGWAGTHISKEFRNDAAVLGFEVDEFESVVEAYYNVAITPAVKTSFHAQYIDSANPDSDESTVLAVRLQLDF